VGSASSQAQLDSGKKPGTFKADCSDIVPKLHSAARDSFVTARLSGQARFLGKFSASLRSATVSGQPVRHNLASGRVSSPPGCRDSFATARLVANLSRKLGCREIVPEGLLSRDCHDRGISVTIHLIFITLTPDYRLCSETRPDVM
jgi:hypothetical protein